MCGICGVIKKNGYFSGGGKAGGIKKCNGRSKASRAG